MLDVRVEFPAPRSETELPSQVQPASVKGACQTKHLLAEDYTSLIVASIWEYGGAF